MATAEASLHSLPSDATPPATWRCRPPGSIQRQPEPHRNPGRDAGRRFHPGRGCDAGGPHEKQKIGRVIVSGMGKSGIVARKIAATLSSTGTPAQFVHPGETSHGDMGAITRQVIVPCCCYPGAGRQRSCRT